jgi:hypothetical protein
MGAYISTYIGPLHFETYYAGQNLINSNQSLLCEEVVDTVVVLETLHDYYT